MLRLFNDMGRAGTEPHSFEDLEHEWRKTGLRHSDLPAALREMVRDSLLLVARDASGKTYKLSRIGIEQLGGSGVREPRFGWRRWLTVLRARWRAISGGVRGHARGPQRERRRNGRI